jgi:hypothetical protein
MRGQVAFVGEILKVCLPKDIWGITLCIAESLVLYGFQFHRRKCMSEVLDIDGAR